MNKLTKIERFFKETTFSADDQLFVGVDVHKKSYHVALYLNDAPSIDFVMPAKKEQLSQTLKPTLPALRQVAYETGFSGYGLAPRIHQSGEHSIRGSINKLSNSRLRSNLNQAAWRWVAIDVNAQKTFLRILNNCGGIKQKAITAMARKLAGHLWMMLIKEQPYDPTK